jgi:hypothetical protein
MVGISHCTVRSPAPVANSLTDKGVSDYTKSAYIPSDIKHTQHASQASKQHTSRGRLRVWHAYHRHWSSGTCLSPSLTAAGFLRAGAALPSPRIPLPLGPATKPASTRGHITGVSQVISNQAHNCTSKLRLCPVAAGSSAPMA